MVRDDIAGDLPAFSGPEAWVETPVRQARDASGTLTYVGGLQRQRQLIGGMPLVNVVTGSALSVAELD